MINWLDDVEDHDFDSALSYLSLRDDPKQAKILVKSLRKAAVAPWRVNDILRAARLDPAPLSDPGVMKDLRKVVQGQKLSPVLLVNLVQGVDIADGYHRVSLAFHLDPFSYVPARLA